jgi:hypothetical protein
VFVSSTFYDLRQIRADLELFVREMGYEPVLHERGGVAYGSLEKLEEYAYREVDLTDMLVSIVGSRYGTESQHGGRSISQEELKRALALGVQVYIFVQQGVLTEFETYKANKEVRGVEWRYVDDVRIYEHLESLYALPNNNPIQVFETAVDITSFLKRQWASLFHRFLREQAKSREIGALDELQATVTALDRVVEFFAAKTGDSESAVAGLLSASHPFFARLRALLGVRYPLYLRTLGEVNRWLVDAQDFRSVAKGSWDAPDEREWWREDQYLKIALRIFDKEGRLREFGADEWDDDWVTVNRFSGSVAGLEASEGPS